MVGCVMEKYEMKAYSSAAGVFVSFVLLGVFFGCQPATSQAGVLAAAGPVESGVIEPASEGTGAFPVISFSSEVHDFGQIDPSAKLKCEFKFTNTGSKPLKIRQPRSTCSCTIAKLGKTEYAPGESGTLTAEYHAPGTPGAKSQFIFVRSNDPKKPEVKLALKAEVTLKVSVTPKNLNLSLVKPNAGCPKITVKAVDGESFAITGFESPGDCITADFDPNKMATKFVLEPKVDLQKILKASPGTIHISIRHPKVHRLMVRYFAPPYFETQPKSIILQNAQPNTPRKRKLWVKSNYGKDFEIEMVSSEKGTVKLLDKQKMVNRFGLDIEITPPELTSDVRYVRDTLYIKIQNGPRLETKCNILYPRKKPRTARK